VDQLKEYLVIPIILVTVIVIGLIHEYRQGSGRDSQTEESIPDFKAYIDVKKKKHAFFEYMLPLIRQSNKRVMVEREILLSMSSAKKLSQSDQLILTSYIHKYKLPKNTTPDFEAIDALLNRIDRVPASLILAQSANESAWGTSRFAKKGKNFFGIWCFTKGCGITPLSRDEGLAHEVAKFNRVQDGVDYYIRMLNSHSAYKELRAIRAKQRETKQSLSGAKLADGLIRYSERGEAYIQEIKAMIRINQLENYNI